MRDQVNDTNGWTADSPCGQLEFLQLRVRDKREVPLALRERVFAGKIACTMPQSMAEHRRNTAVYSG